MTLKKPNWRQILAHLCFVVVHQKGNGGELQPLSRALPLPTFHSFPLGLLGFSVKRVLPHLYYEIGIRKIYSSGDDF